jgi:Asp/Glu/hydantoin racemase
MMRLKFIPPFKVDYPPGVEPMPVRVIREIEAEGLLKGIEWDFDLGIPGPIVENREELAQVVPGVLKLVREACESGRYDAIILIGGLEPGLYAAEEIGAQFDIPVVGCTSSEVAFAYILGHRYTIIDTLECMAINIRQNIMSYGMNEKCASVRSIEWPVRDKLNLDPPEALEDFVKECIKAIEEDGADVIVIGCAALIYMQPSAQRRLKELGYGVPVLHPFKCAIEMAKALVNMKVSQSKYAFPSAVPKKKSIPR